MFAWKRGLKAANVENHEEEKRKRQQAFARFNEKIPYTEAHYTCGDIRSGKLPTYDVYIVGSDQVWNGVKVDCQDIFMLDFLKNPHGLTYAASFGFKNVPQNILGEYRRRINHFDSLLIREQEGLAICRSLGREDAKLVLDPTLLLKESDYSEILEDPIDVDGTYILVYSLNNSLKIYSEAYKLAKKSHCKMVVLKRSFCLPDISKFAGAKELYEASPSAFLTLIKNARCVVTNSYHALLFSVNFNTDFYLFLDNSDEENSRMLTLVNLLGLNDRVFWETGRLPPKIELVDFKKANCRLDAERENSISLLKESLNKKGLETI